MKIEKKTREIITVLGKQGSGKTHLIKTKLLPGLPRPVIIYDPMGEYTGGVLFSSVKAMACYIAYGRPNQTGVYVLQVKSQLESDRFLSFIGYIQETCTIVFEEASKLCNPHSIPAVMKDLINYGRHDAVTLVFSARCAQELHRDATRQSSAIISFQQTEPKDIQILKSVFSQAKGLPDLTYNPEQPEGNEYMIMGNSTYIKD